MILAGEPLKNSRTLLAFFFSPSFFLVEAFRVKILNFFLGMELDAPFFFGDSSNFVDFGSELSTSVLMKTLYIAVFLYRLFLEAKSLFKLPWLVMPSKKGCIK